MSNELPAGFINIGGEYYHPSDRRVKALLHTGATGTFTELERHTGDGALGSVPVQEGLGRQFLVRVTAYRKRLLDEDNLCEKYHVDLLRYAGVIPTDAPAQTKIECRQKKVGPKEPERVLIEVFQI